MGKPVTNPNLTGKTTPEVAQAIQKLYSDLHDLRTHHAETTKQLNSALSELSKRGSVKDYQADGKSPLTVTGLIGQLSEPQNAKAPTVTALPAFNDPRSQPGAIITASPGGVRGLYWFDGSSNPGQWTLIKTF